MRFLKTKISLAQKAFEQKLSVKEASPLLDDLKEEPPSPIQSHNYFELEETNSLEKNRPAYPNTKNISINYGRAMVAFAISSLAKPYLKTYFKENRNLPISEFLYSLSQTKYKIKGINSLRGMLLIEEKDTIKEAALKTAFQCICQVFIKYFSVNWIMHGKMAHKMTYLKYRSKMLRRIQNPELFTYVREPKKI